MGIKPLFCCSPPPRPPAGRLSDWNMSAWTNNGINTRGDIEKNDPTARNTQETVEYEDHHENSCKPVHNEHTHTNDECAALELDTTNELQGLYSLSDTGGCNYNIIVGHDSKTRLL